MTTPLVDLIVPIPQGKFKLEGRTVMFGATRSVILKEGISEGILEMFVLL
jgi:hypothetical protein